MIVYKYFSVLQILIAGLFLFLLVSITDLSADEEYPFHILKKPTEFVLFTMPKSGTHLMLPLLEKLSGKQQIGGDQLFHLQFIREKEVFQALIADPQAVTIYWFGMPVKKNVFSDALNRLALENKFLNEHTPYSKAMEGILKSRSCTVFFLLRDPRDCLVSMLNFLKKFHTDWFDAAWFNSLNTDQQIHHLILGTHWYNSASTLINSFIKWKDSPVCCPIRFEALVGPFGGPYSQMDQLKELRKISNALNKKLSDLDLLHAIADVYGIGWTFHRGRVGDWKNYFNEENKALFKQLLGKSLIELGYEKDNHW